MARLQKKKTAATKARKKVQAPEDNSVSESGEVKPKPPAAALKQAAKSSGKSSKPAAAPARTPGEPNFIQKSIQFLREVRVELRKVTWPNKKQTAGSTVVVIILVFVIASFLGLVDFGLSKLVQVVLA